MRYADKADVLGVIEKHPEGITAQDITRELWPERSGIDFTMSYDWTKKNLQTIKKQGRIECGGISGKSYLWRVRA